MKRSNKAMLAAGMLAGVCMLTGCASGGSAQPTPSPDVAQQQSAEPSPEASEEPAEEAPLSLTVDGKAIEPAAMEENGRLMLPLVETGEALGWTAKSEALSEETQTRRSVVNRAAGIQPRGQTALFVLDALGSGAQRAEERVAGHRMRAHRHLDIQRPVRHHFLNHAVFQAALPDFHARVVDHHKAVFPQSAANAAHGLINSHS